MNEIEKSRIKDLKEKFLYAFNEKEEFVIKSCGRLEILGNHTEYSSGKVINASTDNLCILAAVSKSNSDIITIRSVGYPDVKVNIHEVELDKEADFETSVGMTKGVVKYFLNHGWKVGGLNVLTSSTIFKGAGVSSSSSYAVLVAKLLSYFYNEDKIDHIKLAFASKWAENNYFGKNSGIQDALGCISDGMEILDCKDQENPIITHFDPDLHNYSILLINSLSDHANKASGEAFQSIVSDYQYIAGLYGEKYLRFIPKDQFFLDYAKDGNMNKRCYQRASHYIYENERVDIAYNALINNDIALFLEQFNKSGLSNEYTLKNVCLETEESNSLKEVLDRGRELIKDGAIRVHGGGFGGCSITIINNKEKESYIEEMAKLVGKDNIIEVVISHEPLKIYR